jgi:hypothetical protein
MPPDPVSAGRYRAWRGSARISGCAGPKIPTVSARAWRNTGYVLPPSTICIALATALCFFATIYSLWMLPFNQTATLVHFWLTAFGIGVFWLAFYRAGTTLPNSRTALWVVFAAPAMVLLTQIIFVWNLIQAVFKVPRLRS